MQPVSHCPSPRSPGVLILAGYIGGDAFHVIYNAHPDFSYAVLVRDSSRGALVAAQYPRARLVYGSLDDEALIEEEARKASIVCREFTSVSFVSPSLHQ